MMGTKYLEHCGKLLIENTNTKASCTLDFKQGGMWTASNTVSGTIHSPSGDVIAELEGKWDEQLFQTVDSSNYRILWRVNTYPKDAQDFYGFTSFGITLNEMTSDLEGFLPPTDSRYRPDVRALEEGDLDSAEAEKSRVEEMQRERRRLHADREPRWFRQVGDEWVYSGGYWEERAQGWKNAKIDRLW
jgi:oxysterol-binding protein-related protein 3/6/7